MGEFSDPDFIHEVSSRHPAGLKELTAWEMCFNSEMQEVLADLAWPLTRHNDLPSDFTEEQWVTYIEDK